MKLAWLTDIHLNFIDAAARYDFYQTVVSSSTDGVLVTGDIAESPCLVDILTEMSEKINNPIYFVLGNHDYYRGQVHEVRNTMITLTSSHSNLFWLPASGIHALSQNVFLMGQDGWADGRLGDYANSRVALNDSRMIADLFQEKIIGRFQLLEKMQQLADRDAKQLQDSLQQVISNNPKKVIVLTHVPPFKEACLHQGKISDDDWLPYFSSKIMGEVLMAIAQQNADIKFLVLCGHTHSKAIYQPLRNLTIESGKAEYKHPEIQKIIYTHRI